MGNRNELGPRKVEKMMRRVVSVIVASLALLGVAVRGEAELGCAREEGLPAIASCAITADCAPVGGVDCTSGLCLCSEGPLVPFCSCATTQAPALSAIGLTGLAAVLGTIGLFGLWRRTARRRDAS